MEIINQLRLKGNFRQTVLIVLLLTKLLPGYAQSGTDKDTERMISASRGAASPLFFKADDNKADLIKSGDFYDENETVTRNGLGNFFSKLNAKKPVTIGYIGGSITQAGYGYRLQSAKYIQSLYPGVQLQFLNAGVSGTGTDLAACRIKQQVLDHTPDLVFIEFAVNGAYQEGLEGMIRQIVKNNPQTDICLLYTIIAGQTEIYAKHQIPENIKGMEKVADYYGLPSVHLGMEPATLEKEQKLIWKADAASVTGKLVFSNDGVHPTAEGGDIYAAAIARAINKMKDKTSPVNHQLKNPLFTDNWENANMLDPLQVADFSKGWAKVEIKNHAQFGQFSSWFPYLMYTNKAAATFSFKFKGSMFGFYDLGGPDVGQVTIKVDGKPVKLQELTAKGTRVYKVLPDSAKGDSLINRFNVFCNNRYRGQYEFIALNEGVHQVIVTLSAQKADKIKILEEKQLDDITAHPEKYAKIAFYLGKVLIKGEIIP